jgi:hypothetical protein
MRLTDIAQYDYVWACRLPHKALMPDRELYRRLRLVLPSKPSHGGTIFHHYWQQGEKARPLRKFYFKRKRYKRVRSEWLHEHFKEIIDGSV